MQQNFFQKLFGLPPSELAKVFFSARKDFTYVTQLNEENILTAWLQGKFSGDCDDFAVSLAERLWQKGIFNVALVFCYTPNGDYHVAVKVVDDKAVIWMMDNIMTSPVRLGTFFSLGYKLDSIHRYIDSRFKVRMK